MLLAFGGVLACNGLLAFGEVLDFGSALAYDGHLAFSGDLPFSRLLAYGGVLGFNWGIDPASPEQVHQAQAGLSPRPARLDHDALADAVIEQKTSYHIFSSGRWTLLTMP